MKRGSSTVFAPLDPVKSQPWELFVFDFVSIYACLFACFLAKMTISGPLLMFLEMSEIFFFSSYVQWKLEAGN